jgi:hypothetical protein
MGQICRIFAACWPASRAPGASPSHHARRRSHHIHDAQCDRKILHGPPLKAARGRGKAPGESSRTVLHCAYRPSDFPALHPYPARRLVWSPLRASSDHRFIVGALRAQRPCQLSRHPPSELVGLLSWRAACLVSHCARPTRAFGGRALREHRRSSGSIPSSAPGARDQHGCHSTPLSSPRLPLPTTMSVASLHLARVRT